MELWVVSAVALVGAFLSFFSGFGLGTLLLPAFSLLFPLPLAIAATAVVHMLNNVFKLWLVGKFADRSMVIRFGLTSIVGAVAGAFLLSWLGQTGTLYTWHWGSAFFEVTVFELTIAILILVFSILEILPAFKVLRLPPALLPAGGLLSGFFGGLSGHQGALRSAFLLKSGLSKEAFMGTRVVCACLVDLSRIAVYGQQMGPAWKTLAWQPVVLATVAAFTGAYLGNRYMQQQTLKFVQQFVLVSLVIFSLLLGAGVL